MRIRGGFLAWLVSGMAVPAAAADVAGLERVKALTFDDGVVESVAYTDKRSFKMGERLVDDVPPRAMVKIRLHPAERSNIRIEVWLPDRERWSGRFLGLGNGGSAGSINPEALAGPLRSGYASATTDMGTSPNDRSGVGNPEIWLDFGHRATHLMTVAAKRVIETYYGRPPAFSYFQGSSTGGQQALSEAQRYPDDYDGIVADIPAHCRAPLHAYFLWNWQILRRCPFTPEQEKSVIAAANEYVAARESPRTAGRLVSDPRCTPEDIEAVVALARRRDPSLSDGHADALRRIFDGPRHAKTGERIFGGVPFGAAFSRAAGHLYLLNWYFGNERQYEDIDFGDDIEQYLAAFSPILNAENADLSAFARRGGKLLMASGTADSIVPYHATLDYYERVIERFGSPEAVREFFRFYLIPGRDHGWGGPGVNNLNPSLLELLVSWRENGIAPEGLAGRRLTDGVLTYQVPVYPYPAQAGYDPEADTFIKKEGRRGGVGRVAERFR